MNRRAFLQAITAGLAVCGITRKVEAKSYPYVISIEAHRGWWINGSVARSPNDTPAIVSLKFRNLRESMLRTVRDRGYASEQVALEIDRQIALILAGTPAVIATANGYRYIGRASRG